MRKSTLVLISFLAFLMMAEPASAYWVWSPDIGKWVNPKKSAKDTPEDQFAWALDFYNRKDWDRAIGEFEKLPEVFPTSKLAAEGVYYTGLCWEEKGDIAKAADNYQKLIDKYPYSDRIKETIHREFDIANKFAQGNKMKVLGMAVLSGQDKALELYKHIVKNAPYGTYGDQAQFQMGELYKNQGEYEEAQKAYQAVVDEYPNSELVAKARYQIANMSMLASKKSQYDEKHAEKAIEEFEGFKNNFPTSEQSLEAEESIKALRESKAKVNFDIAAFYDKQKKYESAKVYYQEVIKKYPETAVAAKAKTRVEEIIAGEGKPAAPKKKFILW